MLALFLREAMKKWIIRQMKMLRYRWILNRMVHYMELDGWDADDICSVLLHLAGEIDVLPKSVKDRLAK
jgi:hypothetical protein